MQTLKTVLLSSRFKSFYWRTAMMGLAGFITLVANAVGDFGITGQAATIFGLVLGEISKAINNALSVEA